MTHKGGYFKDERSLGGGGGPPNAVSISNNDVIVKSNNDVILHSEGGRGSKMAQKLRSSLKYAPLDMAQNLNKQNNEKGIFSLLILLCHIKL